MKRAIRSQPARMKVWAVVDEHGKIVNWSCMSDNEEGLEIHRTKRLAKFARMAGERVVRVEIIER